MPPKKTGKSPANNVSKKSVSPNQAVKSVPVKDKHFLAVLVLFVGVSVYAITSFVSSNTGYIEKGYTNVLGEVSDVLVHDDPADAARQNPFNDLDVSHTNFDAILTLYYEGIVSGYSNGAFGAENNVNRAEFAKMLVEASDLDYAALPSDILVNCFTDVKDLPDHWFAPAVCAAKNQGWVSGYSNGGYNPTQNINRAEALKILLVAFGFQIPENDKVTVSPYEDVAMDAWFLGVAKSASDNKIVDQGGLFVASSTVTRGQIAQMIFNAMKAKGLLK